MKTIILAITIMGLTLLTPVAEARGHRGHSSRAYAGHHYAGHHYASRQYYAAPHYPYRHHHHSGGIYLSIGTPYGYGYGGPGYGYRPYYSNPYCY